MAVGDILVGRAAELDAVDGALTDLRRAAARPLVVEGEPGIGKTRLLGELASRAAASGCTVLSGSATELERDLPFWLFVDALDESVARPDSRVLAPADDDLRAELAQVLPSMAGQVSDERPVVQDERYRTHRAVRELLERLAARRPLVLILDDVHWADPSSAELLIGLLRASPGAAVLLALAMRPHNVPGRLAGAIARAERQGSLQRLRLRGLAPSEATALLGDGIDAAQAQALYAQTGGNPFYLEQLRRFGQASGGSRVEADETPLTDGVPRAVVLSIDEELAHLGERSRALLRGAAVAGDPFEPEVAAAAAGISETDATEPLDELLAADLVRATDVPRRFRFRHPLVRHTVYAGSPAGWRLAAHERLAAALARSGAPIGARAHHVAQAARPGDLAAIQLLKEAGARTGLRAPGTAAQWLSTALRLLPEDASLEQRLELLLARARARAATGRLVEAHDDLLETLSLIPRDADGLRVPLVAACADVEHLIGRHADASARLEAAADSLADPVGRHAGTLEIELAFDALYRSDWDLMGERASAAVTIARRHRSEDPGLLADAVAIFALARSCAGATQEARGAVSEAATLVDALAPDALHAHVKAIAFLAAAEMFTWQLKPAEAHARRGYEAGRAAGFIHPTLIPTLGMTRTMLGRVAEAEAALDAGVEAARLLDVDQAVAWSLVTRATTAVYAGDITAAIAMVDEAVRRARSAEENQFLSWTHVVAGLALADAGEGRRALDAMAPLLDSPHLGTLPALWRPLALETLTRAQLIAGDTDAAASAAGRARATADAMGLEITDAWARRAAAHLALAIGEYGEALALATGATDAARRAATPVEEAICRVLAGRALAAAGDEAAGAAELAQAATAFEACGAHRRRDAAERELRRLGRHVHRRSEPASREPHGIAALTGRELEVVRLVVDRKTNPEIAAELYLSRKTVEAHLRNIFRKLDVSTRVQLAREAERTGLARGGS